MLHHTILKRISIAFVKLPLFSTNNNNKQKTKQKTKNQTKNKKPKNQKTKNKNKKPNSYKIITTLINLFIISFRLHFNIIWKGDNDEDALSRAESFVEKQHTAGISKEISREVQTVKL